MPNPNGQPAPAAISPQPVPTTWRLTPLTGTDDTGNPLRVIRLDLATPTGTHTTFFAEPDARALRDALTEQLTGIAIVGQLPPGSS